MDLTVTRAQYDAVRGARHLPDVLRKVLDAATRRGDEYLHTDSSGAVKPESQVFDELVRAILTHPDY